MTKVVQIQYSPESGARSALRLQNAFVQYGVQSCIVSLQKGNSSIANATYLGKKQKLLARIDEKLQSRLLGETVKNFGLFSYPVLGSDISNLPEIIEADIIYIHWALSGFLNFKSFDALARLKKPVVMVLHDMWPITGGCHYSFECEKYKTGCHNCQVFPGDKEKDLSYKGFNKKIKLYAGHKNFYFVSPSKWLYDCARESALLKDRPVFYIPNVLDNTLFKPFDKKIAKKILNINETETVIAFGAVSVNSPYKGWPYLQKALEIVKQKDSSGNITILIFGSMHNKEMAEAIPFKTRFMGYLFDEYATMLVYNAADVFVVPSVADNQPTTVQESLCCGTPVVGFDVGGIPDMINHKQNGYLATYKDPFDLASGIQYCLAEKIKGYMLPQFETAETIQKHLALHSRVNV